MQTINLKPVRNQCSVLVIEDEPLVGFDLVETLNDHGFRADGPARSVEQAYQFIDSLDPAICILDVNLAGHETSMPIATRLTEENRCFVFLTGYSAGGTPELDAFPDIPRLSKPVDETALIEMLDRLCPTENDETAKSLSTSGAENAANLDALSRPPHGSEPTPDGN
ncbi:hypothetical protein [Pseudohoeflea coraliihabitans]|uniref:Response regulatory domain-containing protein n=1 Tax=Pseudohoeflea coraliihabitans TaxID=2860393 RepID=A0ABS6WKT4_9HYPH|nr:hypothetical protein [Pseudohoeflea sp. DP4N28-3]MBW3096556.1 hypothetical protein [Pseudohoeflea sp. DP4N28-3]